MNKSELAEIHKLEDELGFPRSRPWYGYGLNSPRIFFARSRNKHRLIFRLRMAWQRATRGYDSSDLWSVNHTIAKLVVVACRSMRENGMGYPSEFADPPYGDGQGWEAWEKILLKIEEGFQAWLDEGGSPFYASNPQQQAKFEEAMQLFCHYFGSLWD